jgi:hypothetical protein
VFRLLRGLKQDGATSLVSKRRGKPSNHRLPPDVRSLALSIVRERYADYGPTFAAEKLAELHRCSVSPSVPMMMRHRPPSSLDLGTGDRHRGYARQQWINRRSERCCWR